MRSHRLSSIALLTLTLVARSAAADGAPPTALQPPPPPLLGPRVEPPEVKALDTAGRITLGFGIFGLSLGTALGITAIVQHHNVALNCRGASCPPITSELIDRYRTTGRAATASFIAGGALTAAGIGLLVGARFQAKRMALTPLIGPGFAGIEGSFR